MESTVRAGRTTRHRHSPLVRRLARELAVSLDSVAGTGPHGRVTRADVVQAAAGVEARARSVTAPATPGGRVGITQATCVAEVNVTRIVNAGRSLLAAVVHAVALTLRASAAPATGIGVAVDTGRGALVPAIPDAGDLNLTGLARRLVDLERRAREHALAPEELATSSVTVANPAGHGIVFEAPALESGQLAAVGIGASIERPAVVRTRSGETVIAIRTVAFIALTYDSKAWDRAAAAVFLGAVKDRVEAHSEEGEPS